MTDRRDFLAKLGSVLILPSALSVTGCGDRAGDVETMPAASARASFDGPVGVQLYSVRNELGEDLEGTLRAVKAAGFDMVETYSLHDMSASEYRALLDSVGLDVQSMHIGYEQAVGETEAVIEQAKALGSPWVVVPWIPHEEPFSSDVMNQAIEDFTSVGEALREEDLGFAYHAHGYEYFEAEEGGTLFDRFMRETEPGVVDVQMDVFWTIWPGQDPIALFDRYPGRFPSVHIKDLRQDVTGGDLTGHAPLEYQVPIGEGQFDWPAILSAAEENGAEMYFIEYEHENPVAVIESSLDYLESIQG